LQKSAYSLMGVVIIFLFFSLFLGSTVNACLGSLNTMNDEAKPSGALERIRVDYETGKSTVDQYDPLTVDSGSPSVLERLRNDYVSGRLSIDQYILYKVWAVFAPGRLTFTEYALSFEELTAYRKCGSMVVLEVKRNWHRLSSDVQNQLFWLLERPTDSDLHVLPQLYTSPSGHFVLHWTNGADEGKAADATTLAYVQTFAEIFDYVWNFEINTRGYPTPPDDTNIPPNNPSENGNPDGKYDVFIYNMAAYGATAPEQTTAPSISYIRVDNDYEGFPGTQLGCMQVTAAHEFFHAIHFCYDLDEPDWWYETTATYMEDEVYPDVNDNYQYLPDWFQNCDWYGLESIVGLHEYGNFIFAKRLSEDFGDAVIKDIWTEMKVTNGFTAINNVLTSKGSSMVSEFNKFTMANFFLEDMYVDGADYRNAVTGKTSFNGVYLEYQYNEATGKLPFTINNTNVKRNAWMDKWATDYITITMSGATSPYIITFDGLDDTTQYDVSLVTKVGVGVPTKQDFTLNAHKDGRMELAYNSGYTNVVLIIRNSGNTSTKNPSWRVIIAPKRAHEVTFYTTPALDIATITFDGLIFTNNQIGSYNSGNYIATASLPNPDDYVFDHWEYSGSPDMGVYVSDINTNPTSVSVKGMGWLKAVFRALKYWVTVRTSGLPYSYPTHVYVDSNDQGEPYLNDYNSRTFTFLVGEIHNISVQQYVASWTNERNHCPSHSATVNTDVTIVFEYHEEYLVTFEQQGSGGTPHITVNNITYSLPCNLWLDAEVEHTFDYESPIAGDTSVRYVISSMWPTSPYKFTYPATVRGYYKTQYYITINSAHGNPKNSTWVDKGNYLTVSVTSPTETVEHQTRWFCTGYKIDEGELKQGTSYSFWNVDKPHKIEFYWVQQFWLQLDTDVTGPSIVGTGWYDANTSVTISVTTPYQPSVTHRIIFTSWASTGTNTAQITDATSSTTTVTMNNYYSIKAKWLEQWYITVISPHGDSTPSQWVNASKSLSVNVTSPTDDDGKETRYRCTGYKIDFENTQEGTSYTFTNVQASHKIEFQWITQYRITFSESGAEAGNSVTITVNGNPHSGTTMYAYSEWFDKDFSVTFSITDLIDSATSGKRYALINWKNSVGSVVTSPQKISSPNTFTAYYLTQCYLTVNISPNDLSPQPSVFPPGPWYDVNTIVTLTAQSIDKYTFDHWSVDGTNQGNGITSITVSMYEPHTATAYYKSVLFPTPLYPIAAGAAIIAVVSAVVILLVRRRRRKMF